MVSNLRREPPERELGDALLDQRLVAGIGNLWRAEALWHARLSPWFPLGDALLDQRLVAGIGNLWRAEALWHARLSPWLPLRDVSDEELEAVLSEAARLMRAALEEGRPGRAVYRRAGRPCLRCAEPVRSRGQGDDNRTAYWCPRCQRGEEPPGA